ncbi:hypothetical protein RvY_12933 [Ramazzottius varieornatus]|uniref:Uncharacterized protein n=1 Tax=Ramazzottius varieornatus TaxID=947166 RepID=A0A1D1VL64_RAMVA|nr:hypothetical protein RvY_12933 [Ramazzottius varieornatus]
MAHDLLTVDPLSGFHLSMYRKLQEQGVFYKDEFALRPRIFPLEKVVVIPHAALPDPVYLPNDALGPNASVKVPLPGQPDSPFEVQAYAGGDDRWTYMLPRMVQIQSESLNNVVLRKQKPGSCAVLVPGLNYLASSLFPAYDFFINSDGVLDHDDVETIRQLREAMNTVPVEANEYILTGRTSAEEVDYFKQAPEIQAGLREMLVTSFRRFRPAKITCELRPGDPTSSLYWNSAHPDRISLPEDPAERRSLLNRINYD